MLGYPHKNFHSGNILLIDDWDYISDFGQSGPSNGQISDRKLACRCMNTNPEKRPTASELYKEIGFWCNCTHDEYQEKEQFGYKGKEIKVMFEEADKTMLEKDNNPE
ncbi:kinase-like domain-containing protein [Rhizophagus clarus]|uniref:Kinase-like domain-containing protein n=1 Tax=Rhizophagus clarus TaxID=94130 RepID=A0A8H3KY21_9GLOM|nr:kinase-like domain-containing protein [Rhizophagus clarus]